MKKVFLFTHSFPFSETSEAFIENELIYISQNNVELTIIPLYSLAQSKSIPRSIKIISELYETPRIAKITIFLKMFFNPLFFQLFIYKRSIYSSWKNWYNALKYLFGGLLIKTFLINNKHYFPENSIFYSFWFNYTVLGFALAKEQNSHFANCKFYSRAHRYDLYGEDQGIFIPYREKMFLVLEKVYTGSTDGLIFLKEKYPRFADKIELKRLGVEPVISKSKLAKNFDISLISCSYVSPIKRVDLIFSSIRQFSENNPNFNIMWTHIGDGEEMNKLEMKVKLTTPSNLTVNLLGSVSSYEISELFGSVEYDAFINLSISEGLPVTLMMAISAGIPIIATDAGGNREIVSDETGCLLPLDVKSDDFSNAIIKCRDNFNLRKSAFLFFLKNFSAENNYNDFYRNI